MHSRIRIKLYTVLYLRKKEIDFQKDIKLSLAKQDYVKQTKYVLPFFETVKKQSFTYDTTLNKREQILNNFRQNTKNKFIRTIQLFMKVLVVLSILIIR